MHTSLTHTAETLEQASAHSWQPIIVPADYAGPSVALSTQARVAIGIDGQPLTPKDMAVHGYSLLQAWERAALNVERRARNHAGIEFLSRGAHNIPGFPRDVTAMQWTVRGNYIAAWLTHPRTWSRLHHHICGILTPDCGHSSEDWIPQACPVRYFCPRLDTLVAVDSRDTVALACTADWSRMITETPFTGPLRYSYGFPIPAPW
ncbi:hypothetical protein [Corynebacterium renale]|uniref:Uncharacterized protein n=1 Tax=Corynebacterium renale TaxID=1724 RepID=A0A2A9DQK2_9CORY|nr:hypothetical protein [Corynebacterium renale]PFG28445.1 hypothetical protein ATK06_1556 [Corynebacterium renale]SQI26394.1 Uncharacterised protein [Corynebacterium renale]